MLTADPVARARESAECLERDPGARDRAARARAWSEAVVALCDAQALDAAQADALARGACPAEARRRCAQRLEATRPERLRYAFCDAVLAGM